MELKIEGDILTMNGQDYKLVPIEEPQVQEKARTGWERKEKGAENNDHFVIDWHMKSHCKEDEHDEYDDEIYESGNYFNDEQLCDNIAKAVSIYLRMLRWQAENDEPVEIHNQGVYKCCINYDMSKKELYAGFSDCYLGTFEVHFSTEEKAEECIKVFESDLIWLHTQFYHRLDGKGVDNA